MPAVRLTGVATIPADDDAGLERYTGYAVANPGNEAMDLRIQIVDALGQVTKTILMPVLFGSGRHLARFLWQDLAGVSPNFRGSIVVSARDGKKFAVFGLRQDQGRFSALPVIPAKSSKVPD